MQQDPFAGRLYDALDLWRACTRQKTRNGFEDDDYPFLTDSLEFLFIVNQEAERVRRKSVGVGTVKCVPLDIFTDYQHDPWDPTDSFQIHPITLLLWKRSSTKSVKYLLPEVCHPHSQESIKIYGIPFPSRMRNTIVPAASEIDSWNSYYFVEDPDVKPYVAGLTCVPYVNLMESD
ncbi:hypothetical protein AX14_007686 [Amanita brunnescens Koide BX004]|nr:hypothetical protein AX14_007686 [Amanita brunnescens Koide BX004]